MPVGVAPVVVVAGETAIVGSAASVPYLLRAVSAPAAAAVPETEAAEAAAADRHHEVQTAAQNDAAAAAAVRAVGEGLNSICSSADSPVEAAVEIPQGAEPAQVMPTPALVLADASERAIRHLAARGRFRPVQVHKRAHKVELELAVAVDRGRSDKCINIRPSSSSSSRAEDLEVPVLVSTTIPIPIPIITKGKKIATLPWIARSASRVVAVEEGEGAAEAWAVAADRLDREEVVVAEDPHQWPKSTSASSARWTNRGR